jgi:hypothetical protein
MALPCVLAGSAINGSRIIASRWFDTRAVAGNKFDRAFLRPNIIWQDFRSRGPG